MRKRGNRDAAMPFYRRLRILQARILARILVILGESNKFHGLLRALSSAPIIKWLVGWGLAYRKSYSSFAEAQREADKYITAGHEHQDDVEMHTRLADRIRESDYPVLYYWRQLAGDSRRVFDFAGNVGNVFYAYDSLMSFPRDLTWYVYDIPDIREAGNALAVRRQESRLHFVDSVERAASCEVFLASGCLHYFVAELDEILGKLPKLPPHVFANRTPVTDGQDLITLQDNGTFLVPCKIHSRTKLIEGMTRLGYTLKASWTVHELSLQVPLHPESSARFYSGFYFELK